MNTCDNERKQLKAVNLHPGRVKIVHKQRSVRKREETQLLENLSNSTDIGSCFGIQLSEDEEVILITEIKMLIR